MLSYEAALACVEAYTSSPKIQLRTLQDACDEICAQPVYAKICIPSFRNSAMDGFCINSNRHPMNTWLPVANTIAAGDAPLHAMDSSAACEIMTGAPVPEGFDTVIPVEHPEIRYDGDEPQAIYLQQAYQIGQHIRESGEDFSEGELLLQAGERIRPEHVKALAAHGYTHVQVREKPIIHILTTGAEIIEANQAVLPAGKIFNSNGPYLEAVINQFGARAMYIGSVSDEKSAFVERLQSLDTETLQGDAIITTGAVSAGRYDFIVECLQTLGAEIIFHKVKIRPGKPVLFACLPSGRLFFGLPGNPSSAAVGARFFIQAWIEKQLGIRKTERVKAHLVHETTTHAAFTFFKKARVFTRDGALHCEILTGQESFKISPLLRANAWAVLPCQAQPIPAGNLVDVFGLQSQINL